LYRYTKELADKTPGEAAAPAKKRTSTRKKAGTTQ
jgi:hypothetical protein